MDFAEQGNPNSRLSGMAAVIVFHVMLGYALINGMAHRVVEVFNKPLGVNLIEEAKSLPPPPPQRVLAIPPMLTPPQVYVPPPEVVVQAVPQQNVIAATTSIPSAPVAEAAAPVKPAAPAMVAVGIVCPNHVDVRSRVDFPAQAQRMRLSGDVTVELIVDEMGKVSDIHVAKSSNAIFNEAAVKAVSQLRCNGVGRDVRVRVPFSFIL